jgi:hypothetical protein
VTPASATLVLPGGRDGRGGGHGDNLMGINLYLANFIAIVSVSVRNFFMNLRFG